MAGRKMALLVEPSPAKTSHEGRCMDIMVDGVVNLKEISNNLTKKLLADPNFRTEFQKNPRGVLQAAGLPDQFIPAEIGPGAVEEALIRLDRMKGLAQIGREDSIAVACVVV